MFEIKISVLVDEEYIEFVLCVFYIVYGLDMI